MGKYLRVLNGDIEAGDDTAPRPSPSQVLYAPPGKDGLRKMCRNCLLWLSLPQECLIHQPGLQVQAEDVCGYHVIGASMGTRPENQQATWITPDLSGLTWVLGGTSCDTCRFYEPQGQLQGICHFVDQTPGMSATVDAKGCCAAWEEYDDGRERLPQPSTNRRR